MNLDESDDTIDLPDPSLVLLVGPRGAGKTTFAKRFFDPSEIVSFDECRRRVGDSGRTPSSDAQELFQTIIQNRLFAGKMVVVDSDLMDAEVRRGLMTLARRHHLFAVVIAFKIDERFCIARNASRSDCVVSPYEVKREVEIVRKIVEAPSREGIRDIFVLDSPEAVDRAKVLRHKLWTDKREDSGPFDIIGDVHGCADELEALLELLGYSLTWGEAYPHGVQVVAPAGRRVIFLGDLIDRGPRIVDCLRIAMSMVESGAAICLPGNHEVKFLRKLRGKTVSVTHGLAETIAEFERMPESFHEEVADFIEKLVGHFVLDGGKLCVVHAGIKENMQGRSSSAAREFGLYGDTTGETDEYGLPVRHEWANEYHGHAAVVYGHTPMLTAEWLNNTLCLDTGCVFGGALTALRYPEREIISVPAAKRYFEPKKPLVARVSQAGPSEDKPKESGLNLDNLRAGGVIKTRFRYDVAIPEEPHLLAAVEMLSSYGVDPRWLVYLPPVISPVNAGRRPGMLEHPEDAFAYYRRKGVSQVVCQEKRSEPRVTVAICRDAHAARGAFGVDDGRIGATYSRTGRPIFAAGADESAFIERCHAACERAGIFASCGPFIVFEAAVSLSPRGPSFSLDEPGIDATMECISRAAARGIDMGNLGDKFQVRRERLSRYAHNDGEYVAGGSGLLEVRLSPMRILATDETSWFGRAYTHHAELFARLFAADPHLFAALQTRQVVLGDEQSEMDGAAVWEQWQTTGADGMIVSPAVVQRDGRFGFPLPAVECRGPNALRRDHGPEFDVPDNLDRLRNRSFSAIRFRSLRQFMLGLESIERFVEREPLSRVHACVCVALALECQTTESWA